MPPWPMHFICVAHSDICVMRMALELKRNKNHWLRKVMRKMNYKLRKFYMLLQLFAMHWCRKYFIYLFFLKKMYWIKAHFGELLIAPVLDFICPSSCVSNPEWISHLTYPQALVALRSWPGLEPMGWGLNPVPQHSALNLVSKVMFRLNLLQSSVSVQKQKYRITWVEYQIYLIHSAESSESLDCSKIFS